MARETPTDVQISSMECVLSACSTLAIVIKDATLIVWVEERRERKQWKAWLDEWNEEHPERPLTKRWSLRQAYLRAKKTQREHEVTR